ncbi:HAD family hydrolase [Flavobacterium seoulense]|uniref:Haloacid dehalogenase n=1 Tax=Flavobacterium seoulense TaxID=1492738 RepID=A0A066WK82_9FLAO|nr:HAD family hydrolase [Flavobacterium seoulense]KDN54397.1 haloacid dehalogenase [Flavobacterium seoulense]
MKYKCIIFDCDGVLVDSEAISIGTLVRMAESHGANIDENYAHQLFLGKSLEFCFDYIAELAKKKLPDNFEIDFRDRTFEAFQKELQPTKGIHELLAKIKVPVGVASNGPADKIRLNLTTAKLIDRFDGNIFSAYDIKSWKPNPELYLHAAKTMGFQVEDCVVIEDSPAGVQAALSGGFDVFGFTNEANFQILQQMNIPLFDDMANLDLLLQ